MVVCVIVMGVPECERVLTPGAYPTGKPFSCGGPSLHSYLKARPQHKQQLAVSCTGA